MRKHAFEDGDVVKLDDGAVGIYSGEDWLGLAAPPGRVWVVIDGDVAAVDPAEINKFGGAMESKTAGYIAWEPLGSGFRGGYHDGTDFTGWIAKVEEHSLDGTYLYHIFAPGDGTRDYGPHAGGAYTGFATEQRAMDDALEQIERWIANGVTGSRQRNGMRTEAEIVRDLQQAEGLQEQRELVRELDLFRQGRTAAVQADRDTDIANAFIRDTLTPVLPYQHHTAATDWIEEEAISGPYDHTMRVEATMWFGRVSQEVKEDREEFAEQAQGMARRVSGQFGLQAEAAYHAFLETVARLHRQADDKKCQFCGVTLLGEPPYGNCLSNPDGSTHQASLRTADDKPGEVDVEQSGNAESAVTDYDTKDDQEPFLGEDWEDPEHAGVHPAMPGAGEGSRENEPRPEKTEGSLQKQADVVCATCGHEFWDHLAVPGPPLGMVGRCRFGDCEQFTNEDTIEAGASLRKQARPLYEIADEIRRDWANVYFGAVPYLDAMRDLDSISDNYYMDSGSSVVAYFLSNASSWRGEKAKEIKAELKAMLKGGSLQKRAEWEPAVGDRVEVPNPEGETMFDQMETGTITSVNGAYFNVKLDSGEQSPYSWVVEDGVHLIEGSLRKQADTCAECGDEIEKDPAHEDPQTWHHNNGEKHDHEAKPGGDNGESKESRRRRGSRRKRAVNDIYDFPEGSVAVCVQCGLDILLDQREGGGPGKDWGASPEDWIGNGGIGMDYGCSDSPLNDEDGTGGHSPKAGTIKFTASRRTASWGEGNALVCDGMGMCDGTGEVAMIDQDGYIYCEPCGLARRQGQPCRKLTQGELATLRSGEPVRSYSRRRTAGVYCKTHDVWVGDGNADTHEGCEKEQRATEKTKDARRKVGVSLTNVGIEGPGVGKGKDSSGNEVRFKLSAQDEADLKSVLYSDLSVNFTGVTVDEADIIKGSSRTAAGYNPSSGVYDDSTWQYVDEQGTGMGWFSDAEKAEAESDPELAGGSWKAVTQEEREDMNRWYNEQVYLQS